MSLKIPAGKTAKGIGIEGAVLKFQENAPCLGSFYFFKIYETSMIQD